MERTNRRRSGIIFTADAGPQLDREDPIATGDTILILDRDAEVIAGLLAGRVDRPLLPVTGAPDPEAVADVEICLGAPDRIARHASQLPALRWVQSTWAGIRPLLPLMRERPELVVTGVKGIFGPLMAEYVFGWLIALERELPAQLAAQAQRRWHVPAVRSLAGRRLLLLGLGSIGRHLARIAGALGLEVVGVSRSGRPVAGCDRVFPVQRLDEAATGADYLVSVLPGTAHTENLLDAAVFAQLAPGAIVVNGGRASVLVDADLIAAVRSGQLRGAVLDVFREEPLPDAHPFWETPGIRVTAHTAAPTEPVAIANLFLDNLVLWTRGAPIPGRIDPALEY
ncbi:MAG: NAD(P)-dependent oxidoreductase [Pseudomonadales bacterium]|nr:NAD(P)-dependent oxidoreductase [Pseudomonadales bacterium]